MENEFCEIDFTTATTWENFNSRLEEIFYSWKLYQPPEESTVSSENANCFSCDLGSWFVSCERVEFDGCEFDIRYFRKQVLLNKDETKNTSSNEPDAATGEDSRASNEQTIDYFPMEVNCLSRCTSKFGNEERIPKLIRLYDLTDFVLLTSENPSAIISETRVKLLMSSFCISAFNTRCFLPIFTQAFQLWQNCFVGVRVDEDGFRIDYQMIHLGKIPSKFNYFSGILGLFKSKISTTVAANSVWASVKLSYSVSKFTNFAWPRFKRPISVDDASEEPLQVQSFDLPFGAACEPVGEIQLHVTWPKVFENMVMDNENHSDFDPQNAIYWALQVFAKNTQHLLGQHTLRFVQMCQSSMVIHDLIGDLLKRKHFNDLNVPTNLSISRIIPGVPSGGNHNNANESKRFKKFLPEETLVSMLYYLFPDADESNTHPYSSKFEDCKEDASLKGMKTCGVDELPWRLSIIMCIIAHLYGGHAAAQFWYEFTQELRFRWEKGLRVLGVLKGVPNHKTSLINQKLQMLNCCIQKKMKRENKDASSEDSDNQNYHNSGVAGKLDSEDEEFFDCQTESKDDNFKVARVSLWNQPEGRLRKFNNLRLIETGEFMYIPITQEMTPKTEDQLEDDAVVLMKLGSDSQGSKLRARMMCASLYSDMESFKAANPGAILEDFIRWYSPRDWIENDDEVDQFGQKKGKLSNRMLLPGNMWREVWDTSIPVPACRQKCLFDDTKESEKVLHFFESHKNLADVFRLLLPTLVHAALHTIINSDTVTILRRYSSSLDDKIIELIRKSVSSTRNITVDVSQFKAVVDDISEIEAIVTLYKSVEFKLFPGDLSQDEAERNMLMELVLGKREIVVPQGPTSRLGRRITFLFSKENEDAMQSGSNLDKKKDDSTSIVSATNEFFQNAAASFNTTISHHHSDHWNLIACPPYQKEFALHVSAALPHATSRISSHGLTAHICTEEIFIASYFGHDLMFV